MLWALAGAVERRYRLCYSVSLASQESVAAPGIDIAQKKAARGLIRSRRVPPTRNVTIQTPGQLLSDCHRSLAPVLPLGENEVKFDA